MKEYDIIRNPINTEKTTAQKESFNQISFEVSRYASRIEIKKAAEKIFKARVQTVRTMQVKGKKKQRGRILGKKRNWKKAIIRFGIGQTIDFFEGV